MEKTTEAGELTGNAEEAQVVKSALKEVLVADIPDTPLKEIGEEGDVLVMVGAEIVHTENELTKKPKEGSGLISIPTVLEEELQQLLKEHSTVAEKVAVKKDTSMDDKAVIGLKVEAVGDTESKIEKNAGPEGDKEEIEKANVGDGDGSRKKKKAEDKGKKEKKDKKDKEEKKKEKKEKKGKKSEVDRIRKKLEKIHSKIERIYAKKEEYLQRLAEAEEKERKEKERLAAKEAADEAAKQGGNLATATNASSDRSGDALSGEAAEEAAEQERSLTTAVKSSSERNGDALSGEAREDEEAVEAAVKQVEPSGQSSGKQLDEEISAPIPVSNTHTIEEGSKQPTVVTNSSVVDQPSARG